MKNDTNQKTHDDLKMIFGRSKIYNDSMDALTCEKDLGSAGRLQGV